MTSQVPAPIVVEPSGIFDGTDGNWSTFSIRVGNKPQDLRAVVSTLVPETWVVLTTGCNFNSPANCSTARGELFNPNASSTWIDEKAWSFGVEGELGYPQTDGGEYGYDTLGFESTGSAGITLDHQVIAGMITQDYPVGSLGLAARTSNFNNENQQQTSLLSTLVDKNMIPSLAYGYTAGAFYRNQLASLTLGGYDASKIVANNVSYAMAPVSTRDLVVGIQSIKYSNTTVEPKELLSSGVQALVDSTIPNLWLPTQACAAFQAAFGLDFQATSLLYVISDANHARNIASNASVTLYLGVNTQGGTTVPITLPYEAFHLNLTLDDDTFRYFPLRQASDPSQYTLGRTFLQEAFLTVDYGRDNFSVSQVDWSGKPSHIVAIESPNVGASPTGSAGLPTSTAVLVTITTSAGLSTGAIAGIAIGVILLAALAIAAFFYIAHRRRPVPIVHEILSEPPTELPGHPRHIRELSDTSDYFPSEKFNASAQGRKAPPGTLVSSSEIDGHEVPSPPQRHTSLNRGGPIELGSDAVPRAELHSPEPPDDRPDSRAATLNNAPLGDVPSARSVSPTSRLSSEPWGYVGPGPDAGSPPSTFSYARPDLAGRISAAAGPAHARGSARHTPSDSAVSAASAPGSTFPSPASELADPLQALATQPGHSYGSGPGLGSEPSAFTSPQIGYTHYKDDVQTPPPLSPSGLEATQEGWEGEGRGH